jgi:hypothetical protein
MKLQNIHLLETNGMILMKILCIYIIEHNGKKLVLDDEVELLCCEVGMLRLDYLQVYKLDITTKTEMNFW